MLHRFFDIWIEKERDVRMNYTGFYSFWVQSRRIEPRISPFCLEGVAVRPLYPHLQLRKECVRTWTGYALRTARGWNALRLACLLTGLTQDSPIRALVCVLESQREFRLADLLRTSFIHGPIARDDGTCGPVEYPIPSADQTGELGYVVV